MRGSHKLILSRNKVAVAANEMCIDGKKLCLILSDFSLNEMEPNLILIIQ